MPTKRRQEDIQSEESDDDIQEVFDDDVDRGTPSKRARVDKDEGADDDMPMDEEGISDSELERMHEAAINEKMSQMAGKTGVCLVRELFSHRIVSLQRRDLQLCRLWQTLVSFSKLTSSTFYAIGT